MNRYKSAVDAYINPSIIEERKLNVAQMDVFSRLMMDRIIFLGVQINDDVANIIITEHSSRNKTSASLSLTSNLSFIFAEIRKILCMFVLN